jgi:hypothetical protein
MPSTGSDFYTNMAQMDQVYRLLSPTTFFNCVVGIVVISLDGWRFGFADASNVTVRPSVSCKGAKHAPGDFLRTRDSHLLLAICVGPLVHSASFNFNRTLFPT